MAAKYIVAGVPLIAQDKGMACWYASAQMLIQWRRQQRQMTERFLPDPSELNDTVRLYKANNGLSLTDMSKFARMMGLKAVPPQTPSPEAIPFWLHRYGPIWTAGMKVTATKTYGHVAVIVGISSAEILIHDPEPVGVGARLWKPLSWITQTLSDVEGFDFNFLHCPN